MREETKEDITDGGVTVDGEEIPTIDLGEAIDNCIENMTATERNLQLRILLLLNQSEVFVKFVRETFDIHTSVDHEDQQISVAVIEKPMVEVVEHKSADLGLDTAKSLKCQMILKNNGVTKTADVLATIYKILGGLEENAIVTSATDADISKELDTLKAAEKFRA